MTDIRVAVLGCGPAGLLAAHAVVQAGMTPTIFSRKLKSEIGGAQYLHREIPGVEAGDPFDIHYIYWGHEHVYADKVYGPGMPHRSTSWKKHNRVSQAWSMQQAYEHLWFMYQSCIVETEISYEWAWQLAYHKAFSEILSTVPLPLITRRPQRFDFKRAYVVITPSLSWLDEELDLPKHFILYNGLREWNWYRASRINGYEGTEWPGMVDEPKNGAKSLVISKPVGHNVPPEESIPSIYKIGRYGKWKKGELVTNAYHDAVACLKRW